MRVDIVLSDVSFIDRSPRKARLLQWKQKSEPVPAACPAGPGGTLNCERQQSDTTLLLGIQSPMACLNLYWETSVCPQSQKKIKPHLAVTQLQYSKFTPDKFGIFGQMWDKFRVIFTQRNILGALVLGRISHHALLCSLLVLVTWIMPVTPWSWEPPPR